MRSALAACVALLATIHCSPLLAAAAEPAARAAPAEPPPEVKINEHAAAAATAAGVSKGTLDAVAKAIREYGAAYDLGDEKRFRAAITGTPDLVDLAVQAMHAGQVEDATTELARERLPGRPVQPGADKSVKRVPYPRTDYHRRVLEEELVEIKGDDERVSIFRPNVPQAAYVVAKTPKGWRVVITGEELGGVPPAKAAELVKRQRQALEQLKRRVEAGELKTWKEFADAMAAIRQTFRGQVKAAAAAAARPPAKPAKPAGK